MINYSINVVIGICFLIVIFLFYKLITLNKTLNYFGRYRCLVCGTPVARTKKGLKWYCLHEKINKCFDVLEEKDAGGGKDISKCFKVWENGGDGRTVMNW